MTELHDLPARLDAARDRLQSDVLAFYDPEGDEDRLLTADQAASLLQVSSWTVLDWAKKRRIPCLRLGPRTVRFRRSSLVEWMGEQERAAR